MKIDNEEEYISQLGENVARSKAFLNEMARVGYFGPNEFEVYVHTNDPGNIPHFHVRDSSTQGREFHTCIELLNAKYFHHTGKEDFLNSKHRKQLVAFLLSEPDDEDSPFQRNWDALIYEWNRNNSDNKVSKDIEVPDYTKIVDNK